MFSSILDISSFFIGMLINLLLIALICYYFKRKYETLEASQNEQAKILYNLIQSQIPKTNNLFNINELITNPKLNNTMMSNPDELEEFSDNDDSSESDNESDLENKLDEEVPVKILNLNDSTTFTIENLDKHIEVHDEPILVTKVDNELNLEECNMDNTESKDYSKLSMKQLKDILSKKGINSNHRMKKNDLIQLIQTGNNDEDVTTETESNTLNLKDEMEEVNI